MREPCALIDQLAEPPRHAHAYDPAPPANNHERDNSLEPLRGAKTPSDGRGVLAALKKDVGYNERCTRKTICLISIDSLIRRGRHSATRSRPTPPVGSALADTSAWQQDCAATVNQASGAARPTGSMEQPNAHVAVVERYKVDFLRSDFFAASFTRPRARPWWAGSRSSAI